MSTIFKMPAEECVCVKSGDGPNCGARHEGYVCMRPARHEGEHVACSLHMHALKVWGEPAKAGTTNAGGAQS